MSLKAFIVGLPKCGTTTIHQALSESGLTSAHWQHDQKIVGRELYKAFAETGDPMSRLPDVDAITQGDFIFRKESYWPQMDPYFLQAIEEKHSGCVFILNTRDPSSAASSIRRWGDLQTKLDTIGAPGLPVGAAADEGRITEWVERHYEFCRRFFKGSSRFLEYDIADEAAPKKLSAALGIEIAWWGQANANTPGRFSNSG